MVKSRMSRLMVFLLPWGHSGDYGVVSSLTVVVIVMHVGVGGKGQQNRRFWRVRGPCFQC